MSEEQARRIAAFLSGYVHAKGKPVPPNPLYIRDGICVMMEQLDWTKDEIRREALKNYDVIIPDDCFL